MNYAPIVSAVAVLLLAVNHILLLLRISRLERELTEMSKSSLRLTALLATLVDRVVEIHQKVNR